MKKNQVSELEKLSETEQTAWEKWESSKTDGEGDTRYMKTIFDCINKRAEILNSRRVSISQELKDSKIKLS